MDVLPAPLGPLLAEARGRRSLLVLDYDGTLAPFRAERLEAAPDARLLPPLRRLAGSSRVRLVVLSGRPIVELEQLLPLDPLPELWGVHGWEHRLPDGRRDDPPLPRGLRELLEVEARGLADLAPERLERKAASLALHWRGVGAREAQELEERVAPRWRAVAVAEPALDLRRFDGGLELRASGRDKGSALRELLAAEGPASPACYVGDDETDEDAFRVLRAASARDARAVGVLVSEHARETGAACRLTPGSVRVLLERWAEAAEAPPAGGPSAAPAPGAA
ncbi:MAG: trehalose-phosphatase [Chloroflexi bacterium]|nr:trehalose-phosphatase [Chloroflexota bacterium]